MIIVSRDSGNEQWWFFMSEQRDLGFLGIFHRDTHVAVSSKMTGKSPKICEVLRSFDGKIIKLNGRCSRKPCLRPGRERDGVPSGKLTVCYWKWQLIVSFPIKLWLSIAMLVYQRVWWNLKGTKMLFPLFCCLASLVPAGWKWHHIRSYAHRCRWTCHSCSWHPHPHGHCPDFTWYYPVISKCVYQRVSVKNQE